MNSGVCARQTSGNQCWSNISKEQQFTLSTSGRQAQTGSLLPIPALFHLPGTVVQAHPDAARMSKVVTATVYIVI